MNCKLINANTINTIGEIPSNRSSSLNILIIPDEIDFPPDMAQEPIRVLGAEVGGAQEPVRAGDANGEVADKAGSGWAGGVVVGGAIVPLHVVQDGLQLPLLD